MRKMFWIVALALLVPIVPFILFGDLVEARVREGLDPDALKNELTALLLLELDQLDGRATNVETDDPFGPIEHSQITSRGRQAVGSPRSGFVGFVRSP